MTLLTWAILLMFLGLALLVAEVFIPSGGVLGVSAVAAIGLAILLAFRESAAAGAAFLAVAVVLMPSILFVAVQVWPHTPMGRMILIHRPEHQDDVLPDTEAYRGLKSLIGHRGVAKSPMLLSGDVVIHRKTYDAVSSGMPIEPGQPIEVIHVRTNRLVVRPVESLAEPSPPMAQVADDSEPVVDDPFDDA